MTRVPRIGVLGGTFDPPHNAHLAMAEHALRRIPLDEVLFMPAPEPPLKNAVKLTPYADRVEMTERAVHGRPGLRVSRLEEFRAGPSYTVDLLRHWRNRMHGDPFLIIGSDSAQDLPRWSAPEEILSLATIVVFARTGFSCRIPVSGEAAVVVFESPVIDVSSTEIRAAIREARPADRFLPPSVLDFVLDKHLYT